MASRTISIVGQGGIQTDFDLDTLADPEVADVIPDMLVDYSAECKDWTMIAGEHWRCGRIQRAEELLARGLQFFAGGQQRHQDPGALVNLHAQLAHLYLSIARTAPKAVLQHAKYDKLDPSRKTKEQYYGDAAVNLNRADEVFRTSSTSADEEPVSVVMGKVILNLARGQPGAAQPLVERLLLRQPNNVIALAAQARLQFARRAHESALATYQRLLALDPEMSPDPRIGLGLCAYVLGDKGRARTAWERALERDPASWVALLLLGLSALNAARDPAAPAEERLKHETEGVTFTQRAFKLNNQSSAAAIAMASVTALAGQIERAAKLAERAVQFADNKRHSVLANAERGRLGFIAGDVADAGTFIAAARGEDPTGVDMMAELTLGQIAIKSGNLREALNFVEQTAKKLAGRATPLEFTVMHASLLAYAHPGMPPDELARNRATARTMLGELHAAVGAAVTDEDFAKLRGVAEDADVFVELARLWQDESLEKAVAAYQTAVRIKSDAELADTETETQGRKPDYPAIRMAGNLGTLYALQGESEAAGRQFQESLQKIATDESKDAEVLKTVLAYNLGRAFEDGSDGVRATQWFRDVLRRHPEHFESKVRLATLDAGAGLNVDAHKKLKECLQADESNLVLRSVYTHFLIQIGSFKEALAFTSQTLRHERNDVYTYCALGWLHFQLGRDAKSGADVADRPKQYLRSAEAYERALNIDPKCAVAAQGLAIALAEDTLSTKPAGNAADDAKNKARLAGQALGVFSRIKDSLVDGGAVNVNIGHCYFARGEEERAIEAYGAALNAFKGRNVSVLLYLARAWYSFANRESNFSAMNQALGYCQKAMHIQPSDRAILYNIAMIQQKAAEMLFGLEPSKRTLDELHVATKQAQQAVDTFRALAADKSGALPYDADLADQRARYGEGLLRRAPEQLERQETYESEAKARVEEARKLRAEEQARIQAAEAARRAEIEAKAAELAEQRRKAREEAAAWQEQMAALAAEEDVRKAERLEQRKRKKEPGDDDGAGGDEKPKRKRAGGGGGRRKKNRAKSEASDDDDEAPLGDSDEDEARESGDEVQKADKARKRLAQLRKSRRKHEDPDEGEDADAGKRASAKFKSKAYIEDSDDDDDDYDAGVAGDAGKADEDGQNGHGEGATNDDGMDGVEDNGASDDE
ncbi:protein required for normal CLN1 and CLN2 G1 cyclin expression [Cryptotrichosporon argae]